MLNCGAAAPVTVSVSFSRVPHLPQPQISSASLSSHHPSNPGGGGDPEEAKLTLPRYKWRLLIAYDGTQYSGWQYQQSPPTIQCIVESALTRATKLGRKDLSLVGASRTDAGVHAWGQVAHFVTPFNYDSLNSIHAALNGLLPSDIRVREISPAIPEFHARYSAKSKVYCYKGALLQLEVEGSGFLYRQVRNMVALLLQIGREAIPPDIVPKILATRDRKELAKYALSVPPQGLCLTAVKYREEHLQLPTGCPTTSFGRHHSISKCKLPFYWDS
ncbi:uncharacterized protein LOC131151659 isoform X11 [Malania oleifera]|uniref:uncharacterized protein LOC131151659 isoform X11 n=1 Tax=Malania oleifera TaxID=397392 RepID=UPI0025AE679B|nr:uncharacterized protein LOC131151659 isoform X11 [Malania oleifera]